MPQTKLCNRAIRSFLCAAICASASISLWSAAPMPVGLITSANSTFLRRVGTTYAVGARAGDTLFEGDEITAHDASVFVLCQVKSSYTLTGGAARIGIDRVQELSGKLSAPTPIEFCAVPPVSAGSTSNINFYVDRLRQTAGEHPATDPVSITPESQEAFARFDAALKKDPADLATRVAYALTLESKGLTSQALTQYAEIKKHGTGTVWADTLARQAIHRATPAPPNRAIGGTTYAVIIGVSRYPLLPPDQQLAFAGSDARDFYQYLVSPTGNVPRDNVSLLTEDAATVAAVRAAIAESFAKARPNDTILLYVASHGIAMDSSEISDAYLLTYDSDPEDLMHTAMPMSDVQQLLQGSSRAREVRVFIDACRSGRIGSIQNANFVRDVSRSLKQDSPSQVLALLASRAHETSFECTNFEHGAFTYYVLRGLTTNEAADAVGKVTAGSLFQYVSTRVYAATGSKQNPVANAGLRSELVLRNDSPGSPGLMNKSLSESRCENARGRLVTVEPEPFVTPLPDSAERPFILSLRSDAVRPGETDAVVSALLAGRTSIPPAEYARRVETLQVELENAGQRVLLLYLKGESVPQRPESFALGAEFFAAARKLMPDDNRLFAKELFCRGRLLAFTGPYDAALTLLETAIRLDPTASYAYNAIGIAHLQLAHFELAEAALRDAIRLAPYWVYPRHNLALSLSERGNMRAAIAAYGDALQLTPKYSYVAYNLGLAFQTINRFGEARQQYSEALRLDKGLVRAFTAIGLSYALEGRSHKAEENYLTALAMLRGVPLSEDELSTRHDLATLVADTQPERAIKLWETNLSRSEGHIPSLIGIAQTYERLGRIDQAVDSYRRIVSLQPEYAAGRLRLAELLFNTGRRDEASLQLAKVRVSAPENAMAWELSGDAAPQNAKIFYKRAQDLAVDRRQRERIRKKLRLLE